jgi:hypothetical protein
VSTTAPASAGSEAFELTYLYDDPDDPAEVTLLPAGAEPERFLTEWLTADTTTAVSLDEMR